MISKCSIFDGNQVFSFGWQCTFKESKYKNNYLDKVLEPLFFGILNTKPENRAALFRKEGWDMELLAEWKSIPYLNGGLFEQEEVDKYKSVFPAEFFESLFTFFSEYNFTVDENDPDDAEVGVDPEMLGKIFENLLEDNKDKGAFYTPKEIVRYMCRESLIAYLVEKTGITEPVLREFVSDPYEKAEDMEWGDKEVVLNALECVKICDPAIGSGAFPMGLLNELVRCEEAIVLGQEKNTGRAELKKSIIKNNIYGVDIEKGAVDIARLRFWLSIVVDEDAPSPLPNLDYKIMQGDSLLEWYEGVDLSHLTDSDGMDLMMNSECAEVHKNKLAQLLKEYFDESDHGKKYELKGLIKDTITDILDIAGISIPKEIDIAENKHFFLWHTWYNEVFSNNGGFDICLGNPPYVLINKDLYKEKYEHGFKHQEGKIDLYRLFIEFSIGLLNNSGCLSFITPNTFLSIKNCYLLRKFIIENTSLVSVVNYDGSVFEDASVNSIVFLLTKCSTQKETIHVTKVSEANKEELDIPVSRVKSSKLFEIPLNADSRSYEIKDIMLNNSKLLGLDPDIEMCLGAQPYHNSIHTKEQMKSRFLHCDYRKDRDYVQDFSGKHITKYYVTDENNKWVDYSAEFYTKPDSRFFNGPRIVIREIPSETLICGYEDGFKLFNKSVYIIRSKSKDADYLKYILGVLNSKAIGYYITTFGDKSDQKLFPRISMSILKTLPIPKNDTTHQKLIISLVDKIISTKKRDSSADISELEAEIDNVVYMLYGITPEGIGY